MAAPPRSEMDVKRRRVLIRSGSFTGRTTMKKKQGWSRRQPRQEARNGRLNSMTLLKLAVPHSGRHSVSVSHTNTLCACTRTVFELVAKIPSKVEFSVP